MHRIAAALVALTAALMLVGAANAAKLKIGDPMPSFSGLDCVLNGATRTCSADNLKDKDVVVICITCNHCPVAIAYEDRIIAFAKKYAGKDSKVGFVAVNCNVTDAKAESDDNFEKMVERAKEKGFNFPYAIDPSQKLGRDLGAAITPEFFVFNKERKLVYTGPMDDAMDSPKENFLNAAVEATLKGETPKKQEVSIAGRGCPVTYSRPK